MRVFQAIGIALVGFGLVGCEAEHFRAETRLLPDGTVERIVYQPLARSPKAARQSQAWQEAHPVRKASVDEQRLPLPGIMPALRAGYPLAKQQSETLYWGALGKFDNPQTIPDYLTFEAPPGMANGHLERRLERRDAGLATRWVWEETLTDVVTLADQRLARQEAADLAVTVTLSACAAAWGSGYDLQQLEHWLRHDLTACFQEICDAHVQFGLKKNKPANAYDELLGQFAKILQRYGLDLFDAQQLLIKDQPELRKRAIAFVSGTLQKYVRNKQGEPLAGDLLEDTLRTLFPPDTANSVEPPTETRLSQAFKEVTLAKFGAQKDFEDLTTRLGVRILGLHGWPFLRSERSFDYRLEVAGFVVETNGTLIGDRSLRWKFEASEAFPLGYTMRAVVVVPNAAAVAKYFPRAKFDQREVLSEYLDLIDADAELLAALNDLALRDSAMAWKMWQLEHLEATRILELLQPAP